MKIPSGMTKDQVIETIKQVCSAFKYKYRVGILDEDDVEQEAYLLCHEALEKYDGVRPLYNFLCVHLRNRLHNIVRNYNVRKIDTCAIPDNFDMQDNTSIRMIVDVEDIVDTQLDPETRQDYLRLKDGVHVPTVRSNKLKKRIREEYERNRDE